MGRPVSVRAERRDVIAEVRCVGKGDAVEQETPRLPSARVWQAQEIVARQARCPMYRALELMKERARDDPSTLERIAADVVSGEITFCT
jgi:hypothetical protein